MEETLASSSGGEGLSTAFNAPVSAPSNLLETISEKPTASNTSLPLTTAPPENSQNPHPSDAAFSSAPEELLLTGKGISETSLSSTPLQPYQLASSTPQAGPPHQLRHDDKPRPRQHELSDMPIRKLDLSSLTDSLPEEKEVAVRLTLNNAEIAHIYGHHIPGLRYIGSTETGIITVFGSTLLVRQLLSDLSFVTSSRITQDNIHLVASFHSDDLSYRQLIILHFSSQNEFYKPISFSIEPNRDPVSFFARGETIFGSDQNVNLSKRDIKSEETSTFLARSSLEIKKETTLSQLTELSQGNGNSTDGNGGNSGSPPPLNPPGSTPPASPPTSLPPVGTNAGNGSGGVGGGGSVASNTAPAVDNAIPDQNATEGAAFSYSFPSNSFSDTDIGDTLTYTATLSSGAALPAWLSFNASTLTFSGTPLNAHVGTITVRVTADDGHGGVIHDDFDITIADVANAPTVANTLVDQNATEDAAFNFTVPINAFMDLDGDTLTYAATLAGGGALPAWLTFNAATRTFSGTPANGDVGTISIKVTATDTSNATDDDTFDIVVANTNDAPTVANALADQNASQGSVFTYTFAANSFADMDVGDTLTYTATLSGGGALPAWLAFNASTRTFSGTPANGDVGAITVTVTASDGNGGSISDSFDLTVANTNDAPVVANALIDQNATEDAAFSYTFAPNSFTDPDTGDTLTYTATLSDNSALPAWLSFNAATRTFSGTPGNAQVGAINIKVTASDGHGGSVEDIFSITTANTNDAPTLANLLSDQNATSGQAFNFAIPAATFNDIDIGDTLTYSATLTNGTALPAWLNFNAATHTFSGTPPGAGTTSVRVTVTDSGGQSISDDFDIVTIANLSASNLTQTIGYTEDVVADPANMSITTSQANVTATLTLSAPAAGRLTTATSGAVTSTYNAATGIWTATGAKADVNTLLASTTFVPALNYNSNFTIATQVNDGSTTINGTWTMNGTPVNDAPYVAQNITGYVLQNNQTLNFTVPAGTFGDVDAGDSIANWRAEYWNGTSWTTVMPTGVTYDGIRDFSVNGALLAADTNYLMRIAGTDTGGAIAYEEFTIGVQAGSFLGTAGPDPTTTFPATNANELFYGLGGNDTIAASGGNDGVYGGDGNDSLSGDDGNDTLRGGNGNDFMQGGNGNDNLQGEANDDTLYGEAGNDTINGGAGNDSLVGGAGNDSLVSGIGNDTIQAGDGDDYIVTSSGNATIDGGNGNDTFESGEGQETMTGGAGNDNYWFLNNTVSETAAPDLITDFRPGEDIILVVGYTAISYSTTPGAGTNLTYYYDGTGRTIVQNAGGFGFVLNTEIALTASDFFFITQMDIPNNNWNVTGTAGIDGILGLDLNDTIDGGAGYDLIWGGDGDDSLNGAVGSDRIWGGEGNDSIFGGAGGVLDTLMGGDGDDTIIAGNNGSASQNLIYGDSGNDSIQMFNNIDTVYAGDGNDIVTGRAGNFNLSNCYIDLGEGSNQLTATGNSSGNNTATIIGGSGIDIINLATGLSGTVALGGGDDQLIVANGMTATNASLSGNITLGDGNDTLDVKTYYGIAAQNAALNLDAGNGNDWLNLSMYGRALSATIQGGAGDDTIIGGAHGTTSVGGTFGVYLGSGNDVLKVPLYRESQRDNNVSNWWINLRDFTQGQDTIDLSSLGFTGIQAGAPSGTVLGYTTAGGVTTILGVALDNDIFQIVLYGNYTLTAADFLFTTQAGNNIAGANNLGIAGTAGDDTLVAGNGTLMVSGNDGNDSITMGDGIQEGFGYLGNDTISAAGKNGNFFLSGWNGNDSLTGGNGIDILEGGLGSDYLAGGAGNDSIYSGLASDTGTAGDDTLYGDDGNDYLRLNGSGNYTAYGGNNDDTFETRGSGVNVNPASYLLYGDAGNDTFTIQDGSLNGTIYGGAGNDSFNANLSSTISTAGSRILYGDDGTDIFNVYYGAQTIYGGNQNDTFNLDYGSANVYGEGGNDSFVFNFGNHAIAMTALPTTPCTILINDFTDGSEFFTLARGAYNAIVNGAPTDGLTLGMSYDGVNTLIYDYYGDFSFKLAGDVRASITIADFVLEASATNGTAGGDLINSGNYAVRGYAGNDTITSAANGGQIFGGDGDDLITRTSGNNTGVFVYGEAGNDTISGGGGVSGNPGEILRGGAGNDSINGNGGSDWLQGGMDSDTLTGGTGNDFFEYKSAAESQLGTEDLITDFANGDRILFTGMTGIIDAFSDFDSITFAAGTTLLRDIDTGFAIRFTGDVTAILDATDFVFN